MARVVDVRYLPRAELLRYRAERARSIRADGVWLCGSLAGLTRPCIAIVGTRAATAYGRRVAREMAEHLAHAGCCIISGLALGIDAAAHEGALDGAGITIGILGSGHTAFYPRRNRMLAERMVERGGGVISPYAPDAVAKPHQFLQRNGLVAALCDAVVVVEAPERSGALNTAGWAAGDVPVLAVPGDVDRRHAAGCLALIRDGAILARSADDVLEAIGMLIAPAMRTGRSPRVDSLERGILAALARGTNTLDALAEALHAPPAALLSALTILEMEGVVERAGGEYTTLVS